MSTEFQPRTALITGSGRNIGRAIAIAEQGIQQFGRIDVLINNAAIRPSFDLINNDEAIFNASWM